MAIDPITPEYALPTADEPVAQVAAYALPSPGEPGPAVAPFGAVAATLTTSYGADNDVVFTAAVAGAYGNSTTIQYAAAAAAAEVAVTVTGQAIVITPAAKAKMTLAGFSVGADKDYFYLDDLNGFPRYHDPNYPGDVVYHDGTNWVVEVDANVEGTSVEEDTSGYPDLVAEWFGAGAGGSVTASASTTNDALTAWAASAQALGLASVALKSGSDGSGTLPSLAATNLSGGSN